MPSIKIILRSRDKKILCVVPVSTAVWNSPESRWLHILNTVTNTQVMGWRGWHPTSHTSVTPVPTGAASRLPRLQSPVPPSQLDAIRRPLHHKPRSCVFQQMFLSKNSLALSYSVIWCLNKSLTRWSCHILSHHSMFKECLICKSTQWFCKRRLHATRMLNKDYVHLVTVNELNILTQFLNP